MAKRQSVLSDQKLFEELQDQQDRVDSSRVGPKMRRLPIYHDDSARVASSRLAARRRVRVVGAHQDATTENGESRVSCERYHENLSGVHVGLRAVSQLSVVLSRRRRLVRQRQQS